MVRLRLTLKEKQMVQTETLTRVYSDESNEGAFLQVCDFPDAPDTHIGLIATGEVSTDWYGKLFLGMTPEFAIALGEALVKAGKQKQGK
jgi:hypothetical protein